VHLSPLNEYAQRCRAREAEAAAHERLHIRLGNAKVAIFIGILIYWAVTLQGDPSAWVYAAAVFAFIVLFVWHERTLRAMARANAAVAFYRDGARPRQHALAPQGGQEGDVRGRRQVRHQFPIARQVQPLSAS